MSIRVFDKIATALVVNETISAEDKEIYEHGLRYITATLLNIATTLIIGFIFGMVWESILFMASYIPLRTYAGGYHARTPLRCYIFSVILIIAVLLGIKYISYNDISLLVITFISGAIIFIFAPLGDENKPLDALETRIFKKRTRIILFLEIGLIGVFWFLNWTWISVCMAVSTFVAAVMVIAGIVRRIIIGTRIS